MLGLWFMQLVAFLAREADRHEAFPWEAYMMHTANVWTKVEKPVASTPRIRRATGHTRMLARQRRNRRLGD